MNEKGQMQRQEQRSRRSGTWVESEMGAEESSSESIVLASSIVPFFLVFHSFMFRCLLPLLHLNPIVV